MTKNLSDIVDINFRYQRSARIDHDANIENVKSFIVHETAKNTVSRILSNTKENNTFTITGPYGGGKSSLAIYLASLFDKDVKLKKFTREHFQKNIILTESDILKSKDAIVLKIVGQKSDPIEDLKELLTKAVQEHKWKKQPPIISSSHNLKSLITSFENVFESLNQQKDSLVLIIDEMGKYLEFCSEGTKDLHIFQELAEAFARSRCSSLLLGILHQSFGDYARNLDDEVRNNWMKIQGRYFDIPYSVAIDEVVYLLGEAIKGRRVTTKEKLMSREIGVEVKEARLGSSKNVSQQLINIFPLHPLCGILLGPFTRKRFGQNERSLFGFLTSNEPHSFSYFLKNENQTSDKLYSPDIFYDYLKTNLEPSILSSQDGHFWSEAVEAIARIERQGTDAHIKVMKIITLIDFLGRPFDLRATEELIQKSYPDFPVNSILKDLSKWSAAVFRKHKNAWSLFSGSDLDLNIEIEKSISEIGDNFETVIQSIPQIPPVLAKRHYFNTGSLRWFDIQFTHINSLNKTLMNHEKEKNIGTFFITLYDSQDQIVSQAEKWHEIYKNEKSKGITLLAIIENNYSVKKIALEIAALDRIKAREPALQHDPVARRELEARIRILNEELDSQIFDSLNKSQWICINNNKQYELQGISELASLLSDSFYPNTPKIYNELVNKDKPSAVAVAASKNLLRAIIENSHLKDLGIKDYPAELAIYKSIIEKNNIHGKIDHGFGYTEIKNFKEPFLTKLAENFFSYLEANHERKVSLQEIASIWSAEPFGIKHGLIPILATIFYLSKNDSIALFVDDIFTGDFDEYAINRLYNNLGTISFRAIQLGNISKNIMAEIAAISQSNIKEIDAKSVLAVVKPLVKFAFELPSYLKRTDRLTDTTKKVRSTLLNAKDPIELLRKDLPIALGLGYNVKTKTLSEGDGQRYPLLLKQSIDELNKKKTALDIDLKQIVLSALDLDESNINKNNISHEAKYLLGKSGDYKLELFVNVLSNIEDHDNWVHRLAELAADKPIKNWYDIDFDRAIYELNDLVLRYKRLKKHFVREHGEKGKFYISVIASEQNKPVLEFEEPFTFEESDNQATRELYEKINQLLINDKGKESIKLKALLDIFHNIKKNKDMKKDIKTN
jgi:hypothetical protein